MTDKMRNELEPVCHCGDYMRNHEGAGLGACGHGIEMKEHEPPGESTDVVPVSELRELLNDWFRDEIGALECAEQLESLITNHTATKEAM